MSDRVANSNSAHHLIVGEGIETANIAWQSCEGGRCVQGVCVCVCVCAGSEVMRLVCSLSNAIYNSPIKQGCLLFTMGCHGNLHDYIIHIATTYICQIASFI